MHEGVLRCRLEQLRHPLLRQPDGLILHPNLHTVTTGLVGKGQELRRAVAQAQAVGGFFLGHRQTFDGLCSFA
jgi:hypothetical protein